MGKVTGSYLYFYHPQRSCEGYVFTGMCLSTGGGLLRGGCLVLEGAGIPACTEADPTPPLRGRDGYCYGRYASYWNAFLLTMSLVIFQYTIRVEMKRSLLNKDLQVHFFTFVVRFFFGMAPLSLKTAVLNAGVNKCRF